MHILIMSIAKIGACRRAGLFVGGTAVQRSPKLMSLDEVKKRLAEAGYRINREEQLGNKTGTQLHLNNGAVVTIFDNGTVQYQGKNCEPVEAFLKGEANAGYTANTQVFVVYGHDAAARDQLYKLRVSLPS